MEEMKKHLTDIQDICRHGSEAQRHREKHAEARLLYLATGSLMHHLNASSDGLVLDTPDSGLKGDQLFAYVFQQAYSMRLTTNADMEITCSTAMYQVLAFVVDVLQTGAYFQRDIALQGSRYASNSKQACKRLG